MKLSNNNTFSFKMDRTSPVDKATKKTRNRVPTSCDHCRKRKLKCDRQKPCSNCVKSQTEDLCKYAFSSKSSGLIPKVNLNNEIIKLKLQINKLERILQMNNIDVSNYNNIMPEISGNDDDDNSELNDPMVSLSDKFDSMIIKENKILHSGTTSYVTFIVADKQLSRIFEAYSKRHVLIYESYKEKQKLKASEFPINFSQNHLSWLTANAKTEVSACDLDNTATIQFSGMDPPNAVSNMQAKLVLDILEDINKKLPPLYVVNVLVDHFFKFVYPLIPLINEEIFREELSLVLVPTENGGCKVGITHLQNATIVSLLLLILRFAYLAVNIKDYGEDNRAIGNELLVAMIKSGYAINSSFVLSAKGLLMALPGDDSIFKKVTLRNIQVLLYLRLYQSYSPEMHEENKEHSLTLALIIQMCRSLGANRDPSNFPHIFKDEREITVWRRIYYKLLTLDVQNAFEYGCSLIISDDEYDVKLPKLNEEGLETLNSFKKGLSVSQSGDEIKKLVFENAISKDIALEFEAVKLIREGLNAFQNFKNPTKRSNLLKITESLQYFIDYKIPSLWEFLQDNSSSNQLEKLFDIPRVRKFEIRIMAQSILMGFYYLLYLNDENDYDSEGSTNGDNISPTDSNEVETDNSISNRNNKPKKNKQYVVRAIELALSILKINYDYTKYMTQSPTLHGGNRQYKAFKYFSAKCDVFLLNRIVMSFARPFFFLCSIFLKDLDEDTLTIANLLKDFANTIDATVVLKWFNLNVSLKNNTPNENPSTPFCFLLFQYLKDLFFMNYGLKNEYFVCWRTTMIIKLFINYFKASNGNKCSEFLHPTLATDDNDDFIPMGTSEGTDLFNAKLNNESNIDQSCPYSVDYKSEMSQNHHGSSTTISNGILADPPTTYSMGSNHLVMNNMINSYSNSMTSMNGLADPNNVNTLGDMDNIGNMNSIGNMNNINNNLNGYDESDSKFMDEFLNNAVSQNDNLNFSNAGNNLDALIYDDLDNMIEDIFQDAAEMHKLKNLGLFTNNGDFNDYMDANVKGSDNKMQGFAKNDSNQSSSSKRSPSNYSDHYTGLSNISEHSSSIKTPEIYGLNNNLNNYNEFNKKVDVGLSNEGEINDKGGMFY